MLLRATNRAPLLGRAVEMEVLTGLLDGIERRGAALLLHGEAGIGKSRLLFEAVQAARERGMRVLTATGVQSEARLPFAGLHQLLRPVRERAVDLHAVQRQALDAAFGLSEHGVPEPFRIAMAALDLISEVASDSPVLLVVEDAHWLDRPSAEALAFIARRIESDPVLLLVAARDGYPGITEAGLPELPLAGLDEVTAASLLDAVAPGISLGTRSRVLAEAAGNPLALIELPSVRGHDEALSGAVDAVPLTDRLERAFADRVSDLPDETRLLLLVAALSDEDRLDETLEASRALAGGRVDLDTAAPAVGAGIVAVDLRSIRFRHPLMRSAIARSAGLGDRRRAHDALARVLRDQPDRRAWHRAALLSGEHEDVALELERAAARARARGAVAVAVAAFRRAAELGEAASHSRRLLGAASLAVEIGRRDLVEVVLSEAGESKLDAVDRARVAWLEEIAHTRPLESTRYMWLIAAAEHAGERRDHDLHVDLLWLVASRAWWVDPGPEVRGALIDASRRLGGANVKDPRVFAIHAYADPLGHAVGVLARLKQEAGATRIDTDAARFFGPASLVVGAFDLGADFLRVAVDGLRSDGRLGHLPRLLALYAAMAARLGDWETALTAADEARRLADEFADPQWSAAADTVISLVSAMHGDEQQAEQMAARAELVAEPAGANITMAFAQFGKVLAALASGRHDDAYKSAERLFDPNDSAYHPVISSWLIADLAEAASRVDRCEAGRARVHQVRQAVGPQPGTWIALGLGHAEAVLADPADAGDRYEQALAADLTRWPFQRARLQLAYGLWLRRQRQVAESRNSLRAARNAFAALGCASWEELARRELRASGERSRRHVPEARDELTAQELQIAQLAAEGLTNREIGQRLFLSHR
ncbi:MAG TPA: AAA family ATPase, partial [Solirubrobacteraceae bacterium]|nr:AAA family ATPase [Solirubrobacteraceae bacterium]